MANDAPSMISGLTFVLEGISNLVPGINWKVEPEAFPINSQWIYFASIIMAVTGYITCSVFEWLVYKRPAFNMNKLLTPQEIAILLGVKASTIYYWTHIGFIPHVKLGKFVRFKENEVREWIEKHSNQGRKSRKLDIRL